jgi:hypothetical protein
MNEANSMPPESQPAGQPAVSAVATCSASVLRVRLEWAVGCFDDVGFVPKQYFATRDQAETEWEARVKTEKSTPWLKSLKWAVRHFPAIHCHRCGWDGDHREAQHADGIYCPKCPDHKDDHASLSVSSLNADLSHSARQNETKP